jgi:hypothetical protein
VSGNTRTHNQTWRAQPLPVSHRDAGKRRPGGDAHALRGRVVCRRHCCRATPTITGGLFPASASGHSLGMRGSTTERGRASRSRDRDPTAPKGVWHLPCKPVPRSRDQACSRSNKQSCRGTRKTGGYCWPTPKYRNWCAQHAFFEGKKAEQTSPRKSTPRTLKEVGQQYPGVFRS